MKPDISGLSDASAVAASIERWLVSPRSHHPLRVDGGAIVCADPRFRGTVRDGVAVMMDSASPSFFDSRYEVMQRAHECEGERAFCYAQQTALFTSHLHAGQVVLDVGCGPSLPYAPPTGVTVLGLEPSYQSLRANKTVNLRVCGTAAAIPLADATVDVVACFYSIHHMVGNTIAETECNVGRAFKEFGRILKPGGHLFVFEMTPITPFVWAQDLAWNAIRRLIPSQLDMYFWSARRLAAIGQEHLPENSMLEKIFFGTSAFTIIPPTFSLPWLRIPRLLYPLDAKLYKWRIAGKDK